MLRGTTGRSYENSFLGGLIHQSIQTATIRCTAIARMCTIPIGGPFPSTDLFYTDLFPITLDRIRIWRNYLIPPFTYL